MVDYLGCVVAVASGREEVRGNRVEVGKDRGSETSMAQEEDSMAHGDMRPAGSEVVVRDNHREDMDMEWGGEGLHVANAREVVADQRGTLVPGRIEKGVQEEAEGPHCAEERGMRCARAYQWVRTRSPFP